MPTTNPVRRIRILLWVLVGLALIGFAGLLFLRNEPELAPAGQTLGIGGPFTLTDSTAKPFSTTQLAGKPYAIFFGFTHCPDVCPTTLARLVRLRNTMGKGADAFTILFVSVDPERDTPADVGKYAALFDSPVVGLTGTPQQIEQVKKQYGIFSEKVAQPGGDYTVDHTATVLLFDRQGAFAGTIAPEEGDAVALDKLRRISA